MSADRVRARPRSMVRSPLLDWRFHVGASHRFRAGEWDVYGSTRVRGPARLYVLDDELWLRTTSRKVRVWQRDDLDEVLIRRWPVSDHVIVRERGRGRRRVCTIAHSSRPSLARALTLSGWPLDGRPVGDPPADLPARELVEVGRARDWGWVFVTPERVWCTTRLPRGVVTVWDLPAGQGRLRLDGEHHEIVGVIGDGVRHPRTRALRPDRLHQALEQHGWPAVGRP